MLFPIFYLHPRKANIRKLDFLTGKLKVEFSKGSIGITVRGLKAVRHSLHQQFGHIQLEGVAEKENQGELYPQKRQI